MEVTFEREPGGTRLLLSEECQAEEYSCRLLERNPGRHLLRLSRRQGEEGTIYAFEIPGGNSLAGIFRIRSISFSEIRKVMLGIARALEEAESSLLPPGHLILEPELIFCLPDLDHMAFCCHPGVRRDFFEQIRKLLRYFLQKMDHQDTQGTEAMYQLFAISEQEYFRFEDLMEVFGRDESPKVETVQEVFPEAPVLDEQEMPPEQRIVSRTFPLAVLLLAAGAISMAAGLYLRAREILRDWHYFLIPCCLFAVSLSLLARMLAEHVRGRKEKEAPAGDSEKREVRRRPAPERPRRRAEPAATDFLGDTTLLRPEESASSGFLQLIPEENGRGDAALLRHFPFVIGKLKGETDLMLNIPSVSRLHARIERSEGQLSIRDCRSTNGTWVNGIRLEPEAAYPLSPGDRIRFADVCYRLEQGLN